METPGNTGEINKIAAIAGKNTPWLLAELRSGKAELEMELFSKAGHE
jgi:hypothetical protein